MAFVFLHVVGDLTLGKPEIAEFADTETVESAIRTIGDCAEGAITVWKKKTDQATHGEGTRAERFVGILNSLDLVAFLAGKAAGGDHDGAMRTPVSEVVRSNSSLLKEVDPGTRLIDALELMTQGVRRLLVRKVIAWKGVSKTFSVLYSGRWLKAANTLSSGSSIGASQQQQPSSPSSVREDKYCCLSREDVVRFLIGCLGALAPIPLSPISSLGAITPHFLYVEASLPALEAVRRLPEDPCAVAVVENGPDGVRKIIGEISSYTLWKCDYTAAAWAMANLSAGQFVTGAAANNDNNASSSSSLESLGFSLAASPPEGAVGSLKARRFSSRSIGFVGGHVSRVTAVGPRSMYRGRSSPLTCKETSSLAAVMAQMLSYRATHVWVTDSESDDSGGGLLGVIGFSGVLRAVIKSPCNNLLLPASS